MPRTWLSVADLKKFLAVDTMNDTKGNALKFSALTGLRRGELLALKWSDIDFQKKVLKISRSLTRTEKGWILSKTKTEESLRTIPLSEKSIEILLVQKELTGDKSIVFSNLKGRVFDPNALYKSLDRLLENSNLTKVRVHDLRHSFASVLHEANVDHKTIQSLLGHSNIQTTLNIYVHPDDKNKKKAAQTMDDLLK